jgi:two-component system sensor histidine kinase YesM
MKIKLKLFLTYLIIVVFMLSAITFLLLSRSTKIMTSHVNNQAEVTLKQISQNLDQRLQSFEDIAYTFYLNMPFQQTLLAPYDSMISAYDSYFDVVKPYVTIIQTTKDVHRIKFYTPNPSFSFSNIIYLDDEISEEDWFLRLKNSQSGNYWADEGTERWSGTDLISLKQRLNYYRNNTELLVSIEVNKQVLYNMVNEEAIDKRIIIQLPGGEIIVDTASSDLDEFTEDEYAFIAETQEHGEEAFTFETEQGEFLVFHQTLERTTVNGTKVIMMVPIDEFMNEIRQTRNLSIILLLITCLVAALVIYFITTGLLRRLMELSDKMKKLQQDNFKSFIEIKDKDEIGQLGVIFNRMVKHLDELIHEVYVEKIHGKELQLRTKEAQLYAMQTQINPHYLFNVLNSIRGNLLEKGDIENAEIISLMAKSFRILLKKRNPEVTLREEIELVMIYLRIQKYRYGDRLNYQVDIPEYLLTVPIPTMTLQTLVDNVIIHVMEKKDGPTLLNLSARVKDDDVILEVNDDGPGIPAKRLEDIRGWLNQEHFLEKDRHLGLQNVHYRIHNMYGSNYGLNIESDNKGTRIKVIIPRKDGED